jgi:hypothetical protein
MPLWAWLALGAGALLLFGSKGGRAYAASTSQGDVSQRTDADWQALWALAQSLGTTPQILGLLLFEESGMDPGAKNTNGHPDNPAKWCVGLNQFCPGTYEYWVHVSPEEYLTWTMAQQLGPIGRFWASKPSSAMQSARDLFWVNFLPATYVPNASPDTIINDPNVLDAHYALVTVPSQNPGLFPGGATTLTAGDLDNYLAGQAQAPGWQYALQRIAANAPVSENA